MKVSTLAKKLDLTIEEIGGALDQDDLSGSDELSNDEAMIVAELLGRELPLDALHIVRIWSEVRKHAFMVQSPDGEEQMVKLQDYCIDVVEGGVAHQALKALRDPEMRVVEDKPFSTISERTRFREMLEANVITGPNHEPSADRGMAYLQALFFQRDQEAAAKAFIEDGVKGLIELACSTKSYKPIA
jgi:hypothetical protein